MKTLNEPITHCVIPISTPAQNLFDRMKPGVSYTLDELKWFLTNNRGLNDARLEILKQRTSMFIRELVTLHYVVRDYNSESTRRYRRKDT